MSNKSGVVSGEPPEAPQPKEIDRRVSFYKLQAIGLPILALIPLAGIFGLFDSSNSFKEASQGGFTLQLDYPAKLRFQAVTPMYIFVRNESGSRVPQIDLEIERAFLREFEKAEFSPEPDKATAESCIFELKDLKQGETRVVAGRFEFDHLKAGLRTCNVRLSQEGREIARTSFQTFLYP
jgi:hypothetical protein